jgi:hypothetical protein
LFLYDIFKVIYAPLKAFREILGNPRYVGPIIIIIISVLLAFGTQYAQFSKIYVETIAPSNRVAWTNMTDPASMWTSNGRVDKASTSLFQTDILVGNYSVIANISNSSELWLKSNIEAVNCSEDSGFTTLYYKLMYTHVLSQNVSAATLRLFSLGNESNFFEFNLLSSASYLSKSLTWVDANVTLVSGWTVGSGSPDWSNITGIEFLLQFPQASLSLQLNDLHFGGKYESYISVVGIDNIVFGSMTNLVVDTVLRWIIFAGMLWLTIKTFHTDGSPFKILLVIVGYVFVVSFVLDPINLLLITQLPAIRFPFSVTYFLNPNLLSARELDTAGAAIGSISDKAWYSTPTYALLNALSILSVVWTVALAVLGIKALQTFSWKKTVLIGVIAYLMAFSLQFFVQTFLGG